MNSRQTLILATVVVLAGYVLGLVCLGTPPVADASGDEVIAWFRQNAHNARLFAWANTITAPALATMVVLLRRLMPQPHRDVFLLGGASLLITGAAQSWFWAGLAIHAATLTPAVARSLFDVVQFWGPVLTGATMTMIGPATLLALGGYAGMPKWLALIGAVTFVEQAIETITIFGTSGFTEPGGAMNLQLGAGLFLVWFLSLAAWGIRASAEASDLSPPE